MDLKNHRLLSPHRTSENVLLAVGVEDNTGGEEKQGIRVEGFTM